jgi:pyruvate dehydrogenase E1 component
VPLVTRLLGSEGGPVVAVTDFMKMVPDQVARWVRQPFVPLGTDGFGRSDTRERLRQFFEVDARQVVVAVLSGLAQQGEIKSETVAEAIAHYGIDSERTDPRAADL